MVEGDLSLISSELVRSAVAEIGKKYLKTNNVKIHVKLATKAGENFLGIVYRVMCEKADCDINTLNENVRFDLILKVAPTNVARRTIFRSREFFMREIFVYDKMLPSLKEFQQSNGIQIETDGFHEYPKCYRTFDSEPNECLLLEDLKFTGFTMIDYQKEAITVDHVKLVMQALGKLHAISFALKDQKNNLINEVKSNVHELFFIKRQTPVRDFFGFLQNKAVEAISGDQQIMKRVENLFKKHFHDLAADCLVGESAEPYAVICQGDSWSNNILFKSDENGSPTEARLIDWQVARYASPVTDILYYIFGCVSTELRQSHYDYFLREYHQSLSTFLRRLGSDPEKLFPYDAMLEQLKKFGHYGLITGIMLLRTMVADKSEALDLDEISEQMSKNKEMDESGILNGVSNEVFTCRIRELIQDMIRLNYI